MSRKALLFLVAAAMLACSGPSTPDGSSDANTDAVASDVNDVQDVVTDTGHDAGTLFGPCTTIADCPGPSATCIRVAQGYPNGQCSRRCVSDSQCGADGACLPFGGMNLCFHACSFGSDCRDGYNCFQLSGDATMHYCFPLCGSDTQCPGARCDLYTGFCGTTDTTLADNGAPCSAGTDCRSGRCLTELNSMGDPTGNLDGLCYSLCTIPPDDQYAGTNLPQGGCPMGSVCERGTSGQAGDIGFCRSECTTASDCRPGYICVHPNRVGASGQFTDGYCAAMNCHYMTQTCPSFATCQTTAMDGGVPTSGICIRNGDGGVSDASEAGESDATDATDVVDESDAMDATLAE